MTRSWSITIVAPCEWLTMNKVLGTLHPMARSRIVAQWRRAACAAANVAMLPTGLDHVLIEPVAHFRGRAPVKEAPNLAPTIKACVDGLGPQRRTKTGTTPGHGLVSDDDDKHVTLAQTVIGDKLPAKPYAPVGELVLTITEVTS